MTDLQGLFMNILMNPKEDTPRLVYSDYIEEQGDEASAIQAQFIRKQIFDEGWQLFYVRNHRTLSHRINGIRVLVGTRGATGRIWGFTDEYFVCRRGFAEVLTCSAETWLKNHVRFRCKAPIMKVNLLTMPQIEGYDTIMLYGTDPPKSKSTIKFLHVPDKFGFVATGSRHGTFGTQEMSLIWPNIDFEFVGTSHALPVAIEDRFAARRLDMDRFRIMPHDEAVHGVIQ